MSKFAFLVSMLVTISCVTVSACADNLLPSNSDHTLTSSSPIASVHLNSVTSQDPAWATFASGTGISLFVVGGTLLPLLENRVEGKERSLRTADSLLSSTLITEVLKKITHEKRPDSSDYKSFPSGHATAAFAVATMQAHYHPRQALLWYGGATLISASRVILHRHYSHDVIVGAAVGFFTSRLELKQQRGLLLFPFISGEPRNPRMGISLGGSF